MHCWIYKSRKKDEMYLYLPEEADFSSVPDALMKQFGSAEFVMKLTLDPKRKLHRADVTVVMRKLRTEGYYLQLPPRLRPEMYHGNEA